MTRGRPLRFLAMTLGGWTAMRVALLWPTIDGVPALIRAVAPPLAAATRPAEPMAVPVAHAAPVRQVALVARSPAMPLPVGRTTRAADPTAVALAIASLVRFGEAVPVDPPAQRVPATIPPPLAPTPPPLHASRLAGSAWLLARGGASGTLTGGQLGGSQAGARITYALGDTRRLALAARVATPLQGRGAEAALGVEWRPLDAPIRLIAEQRFSLDGGRGGPTLMAVGGINPTEVAAGFRLEAYAQGGAIKRDVVEGFADGAARVTRPVSSIGRTRIDLGVGSWGAVQRGVGRLDVGPTMGVQLPLGQRSVRLTLDWRQRVAGNARPGSGPALSLGSDF